MTDKCPTCGQWMPAALEVKVQSVIELWNEVASLHHLPLVRRPASLRSKVKSLLREESDLTVLKFAFVRFASNDFIREHRYGLANFLPNRHKYLEAAGEDAYRAKHRETGPSRAPGRITYEEMARAAGVPLDLWLEHHKIGGRDE